MVIEFRDPNPTDTWPVTPFSRLIQDGMCFLGLFKARNAPKNIVWCHPVTYTRRYVKFHVQISRALKNIPEEKNSGLSDLRLFPGGFWANADYEVSNRLECVPTYYRAGRKKLQNRLLCYLGPSHVFRREKQRCDLQFPLQCVAA